MRDARPDDASAIAEIWASATPYLVRSASRAAAELADDSVLGRQRWVGTVNGEVAGTGTGRRAGHGEVMIGVEVRPDLGSRGVGRALLAEVLAAFADATELVAVCNDDPISMSFAVRHNFLPVGEHQIAFVEPATVTAAGPAPEGLTGLPLDRLPDLAALLDTHNAAAPDDPSGLSRQYTPETFRADWWDSVDNAPELSWALFDASVTPPVVAAFTSVQVDRATSRAWSSMTATHPSYRGRGLAAWVKRRSLNALANAGIDQAWTGNDAANGPMLAVNASLGYVPAAKSIRVHRRLHR